MSALKTGSLPAVQQRQTLAALALSRKAYSTQNTPSVTPVEQVQTQANGVKNAEQPKTQTPPPEEKGSGIGFRPIPVMLGLLSVGLFITIYGV